ncbi:hypothetical protein [Halomonas sp. TD01]|uniref:hypothetical protein n=1 Tax=Halomonas sp. TD01 TaxID=999141 RepID=UPI000214DE74|nr:hypothetical protein [Halomonas sp. TD01]EGP21219.1 hypothetical protein GME_02710 [Halomonas sp. TD01]CAH1043975.1 hypothetical protein HPTD01_2453 [Halomonas sp. TD01]
MSQNVDLLVHIGPLREESETLLKHVNQVTLLAPLSPMLDRQQALAKNLPALHITEQPVTPPGGEAVCYAYTLKDFNSLAPASELTSLYPGLGKARHQTVDTQTLPQALEQAGLSQATLTHLIIEQPEIALSLLQVFNHSGLLDQLTHLWVRTSPLSLYEGMATNVELAQWCEQHGFEVGVQDAEDPDFFLIELTRNPLYSKLKAVQEQLAEHETQFSHLSAERDTLKKALAETEQNSKQYAQKAQQQLKEKDAQLGERDSQLQQLTEEHDALKKILADTEQNSKQSDEKAQQQLKEKDAQLGERASQLEQLSTERDKLKKTLAEAEQNSKQSAQKAQQLLKEKDAQLGERASQLKQLTEERDALKKTLAEAEQNSKQSAQKAQQQLKEKDAQLKEKDAELAERDTQLSQLTEERDTLKKQLNQAIKVSQQHQKEHQESEQRLKDVTQKYEAVEQQLQNAVQSEQKALKKLEETHAWFINRKQQAEEGAEQIKALQAKLTTQQAQSESLQENLTLSEEERENYQRYFANSKKQHEESEAKLVEAQQQLTEKDAMISQLSEQLATLKHSNERFGQLESKLESLFGEQRSYIQQTTSALGQHVTRSARQQRDEQALTHYLQHGQRPVSTQLAPGYAMALLVHYDTHHHDVVVIFGSLNTTELLAQSIINARTEQPRLIRQNGQRQETHNEVTLSHDDLPQTIVSIQHQKTVSDELKERLNNKRLSHAVNVVYAPWGECQANDQTALFYSAETTLQRLNQWLPEDARVLIIVGETLPEAGHSREVALPLLLKQLPTQRLDIVLESNSYPQESNLVSYWDTLLETRQRPAQWLTLPNAYSLRVE